MVTEAILPITDRKREVAFPDDRAKLWRAYPVSAGGTVSSAAGIAVTAPGRSFSPVAMVAGDSPRSLAQAVAIARKATRPERRSPLRSKWASMYSGCIFVAIDERGQEYPGIHHGTATLHGSLVCFTLDGAGRLNKGPANSHHHHIIQYFRLFAR